MRTLVAGIDCSTQSTKVLVCDAATGQVVRSGSAPHPDVTEIDPAVWAAALESASSGGLLDDVAAISVGGQQHGMVALDDAGEVVRPALLWNDTRSARAATELIAELGGPEKWAEAVGSVPVASFTVTKLRWLAEHEPELAERVVTVMLPHDWLTAGLSTDGIGGAHTDRGDASGTGYWSPFTGDYRTDLLRLAFGRELALPPVAAPAAPVGRTAAGAVLGPGTGDNMAAALGLGAVSGDVTVSIGTSGVVAAVSETPTADATGLVAGFADGTGRFLPLVCTLNAARVLSTTATLLGVDLARLDELALSTPDSDGLVLLPFLDGERTPDLPDARGLLTGLTRTNATPARLARATVEGLLCGLADGLDALRAQGVPIRRAMLIGGGARSAALRALAPAILGVPVVLPEPGEYVALGAARQAAWTLSGDPEPPDWRVPATELPEAAPAAALRAAYADVLAKADPLLH
jgi:xylulokinase